MTENGAGDDHLDCTTEADVIARANIEKFRQWVTSVTAIRETASPRHVPDEIIAVAAVPRTRTGKKLEGPIKRLMQGAALADVVDPQTVVDPDSLKPYSAIAAARNARR